MLQRRFLLQKRRLTRFQLPVAGCQAMRRYIGAQQTRKHYNWGASAPLRAADRAIRSNLFACGKKYFRFYPLRG
jgi:hypothetical protein